VEEQRIIALDMPDTSPDRNLSVLLVEDSAVLAERLSELLAGVPGMNLTAVVDNESAAIQMVGDGAIDVILLDLHLREGTGFGVLRAIMKQMKRPVVVVLTNYDLAEYRRAATSLGAQYFLDKARDMEQLPDVLDTIRAGIN
jgi:two-component system OmpR family response regulator